MPNTIFFDRRHEELNAVCQRWNLSYSDSALFELRFCEDTLTLHKRDEPEVSGIAVDFVTGAAAHRRKFGGGKGQAIARAVGLKKGDLPAVIDATAGLGRDGFVLASLGCDVTLIERQPVVAALLEDGLKRAYQDPQIGEWTRRRMRLHHGASQTSLTRLGVEADVVYLDPMYPRREKSAKVKKEMRLLQTLVGSDEDADQLLNPALRIARKRVVVKRPDYAEYLDNKTPSVSIKTRKNRFDLYPVL